MPRRTIRMTPAMAALLIGVLLSGENLPAADKAPVFDVITVSAAITPPIAEYIVQSIGEAAKSGAEGLSLRLDTPGGLDLAITSARPIPSLWGSAAPWTRR
ncbi:MAG: hypothetical protein NTW71_07220 [Deltaproteobacteria bacterium]|nr:hypothetical protein [Deltaproteobacteria bacterium]